MHLQELPGMGPAVLARQEGGMPISRETGPVLTFLMISHECDAFRIAPDSE